MSDDSSQSPLDRVLEDVYDEDDLYLGLYLINHGCGGYEGMVKLLCEACFWGNLDVVEELVELHRINPNCECVHHVIVPYHCSTCPVA